MLQNFLNCFRTDDSFAYQAIAYFSSEALLNGLISIREYVYFLEFRIGFREIPYVYGRHSYAGVVSLLLY